MAAPPLACLPLPVSWLMSIGVPVAPSQIWSLLIGRSLYFDDDWKTSTFPVASSDGRTAAFCLLAQAVEVQSPLRSPAPATVPAATS